MKSIFSLFFYETTFQQKKLIISVTILFGLLSPGLIGLAVWFKEPQLLCQRSDNLSENYDNSTFQCDQETACFSGVSYWIDEKSAESIATRLSLICDRKYLKRVLISSYFFGGVLGCIMNILVYIPAKKRKIAISFLGIIHASANIGIVFFSENINVLPVFLAILSFTWIIIHSYCFMIMNENFQGDLAKSVIMIMMVFWGFSGIVFSVFCYVLNANYQLLFMIIGTIYLVISGYLMMYKPGNEPRALSKTHNSIFSLISQMWAFPQIRFNVITFVISWSAFCVTYNDVFLRLETVGGSLYFNMGMISAFEMSASFISGIISLRFNISDCIKSFMVFLMFLGVFFLFAPIGVKNLSSLESAVLLIMMILTKFSSDVINNLINLYSPKIFTDEFIGTFLILSRLSSRIFLLALPTVNYSFELMNIHPFFFLTILWLFCWILAKNTKEIQEEGISDVLKEFKVNLTTRISIIHNSEYLHVDDVLSNIIVDSKRLSEIRASRIMLRKSKTYEANSYESHRMIEMKSSPEEMIGSLEKKLIDRE